MEKICLFKNCLNSPEWLSNSDMIEVRAGVHGAEGSMRRCTSYQWTQESGAHTHTQTFILCTHTRAHVHTQRDDAYILHTQASRVHNSQVELLRCYYF